jgi:hypothetical protein
MLPGLDRNIQLELPWQLIPSRLTSVVDSKCVTPSAGIASALVPFTRDDNARKLAARTSAALGHILDPMDKRD